MNILSRFKGRRVFVTGDTGFKGSWLSLWLADLGAEVHGYALPPRSRGDLFCRLGLAGLIRHQDGDIRDLKSLARAVRRAKPEYLFHLAAQPIVRQSYRDPVETFATNVQGSVNVLEAARSCPSLRSLVYVTSDKCYRNKDLARGYREDDELGGGDPYSASKACAELVFEAYRSAFLDKLPRLGAASARAGNVIGGGDMADDRIVPDCVRALRGGKTLILRRPRAVRPWQHVLEPTFGYLLLATRLRQDPKRFSGAWNFGPRAAEARPVIDLVNGLSRRWRKPLPVKIVPSPLHEAHLLRLDASKSRRLGWRPRWDFRETIARTADWYAAAGERGPVLDLSRGQIRDYLGTKMV